MIVRRIGDMHVLTTQVDHARASGQLAHAIDERYCDEQFYHEIIPLITHHDEGWAEWEKNPRRDVSGAPINFMDVDTAEHESIWRRGINFVHKTIGPYAAAVLGRHAQSLASDLDFRDELSRRILDAAREAMPHDDPVVREWHIERSFYMLQLCDVITLIAAAGWEEMHASLLLDNDARPTEIHSQRTGDWEIHLDEWPFVGDEVVLQLPVTFVRNSDWDAALRLIGEGHRTIQEVTIRPHHQRSPHS